MYMPPKKKPIKKKPVKKKVIKKKVVKKKPIKTVTQKTKDGKVTQTVNVIVPATKAKRAPSKKTTQTKPSPFSQTDRLISLLNDRLIQPVPVPIKEPVKVPVKEPVKEPVKDPAKKRTVQTKRINEIKEKAKFTSLSKFRKTPEGKRFKGVSGNDIYLQLESELNLPKLQAGAPPKNPSPEEIFATLNKIFYTYEV